MKQNKNNKNRGFTLMEAIVSVAIAGVIIISLGQIFTQSLLNIRISRENLKASQLAQSFVEYTKGVLIETENGFHMADGFIEEDKLQEDFYYEKKLEGSEAVDGKYNVSIKVYPNVYVLGGNNTILQNDGFSGIYANADTSKLVIPVLGDIVEKKREVKIIYEDVDDVIERCDVEYSVTNQREDATLKDNFSSSRIFEAAELTGKFVLFYKTTNFDSSMSDVISIYNRSSYPITIYVLKDMKIKDYPKVKVEEGAVTIIKDIIYEESNDRRLYKIVVTVSSDDLKRDIVVEATKNEQY